MTSRLRTVSQWGVTFMRCNDFKRNYGANLLGVSFGSPGFRPPAIDALDSKGGAYSAAVCKGGFVWCWDLGCGRGIRARAAASGRGARRGTAATAARGVRRISNRANFG